MPLAALGLAALVLSAALFHVRNITTKGRRVEAPVIVMNTVLGLLALFVFVGRTFIEPLA